MPTGVGPLTVAAHEDFARAAGRDRASTVHLRLDQVVAPDDGHIAKVLNFGVRKFEANQLASTSLKLLCGLEDQCLKGFCVAGKPRPPHRFAHMEQLTVVLSLCQQPRPIKRD